MQESTMSRKRTAKVLGTDFGTWLVGKVIDPAAQSTDMTLAAHDQMFSDPAQRNAGLLFDQVTNQALAPIVLS